MKKQQEHVIDVIFSLSLLCVFTVCGLLVVFIGINVYKSTVENMGDAFSDRTAMAYVAKKIRQNDRTDGVDIVEVEGQTALLLCEEKDGETYCTYIYYYNGYLQELYTKASFAPVLTAGQSLIEIDGFTAIENADGTVTVTIYETAQDTTSLTLALAAG